MLLHRLDVVLHKLSLHSEMVGDVRISMKNLLNFKDQFYTLTLLVYMQLRLNIAHLSCTPSKHPELRLMNCSKKTNDNYVCSPGWCAPQ